MHDLVATQTTIYNCPAPSYAYAYVPPETETDDAVPKLPPPPVHQATEERNVGKRRCCFRAKREGGTRKSEARCPELKFAVFIAIVIVILFWFGVGREKVLLGQGREHSRDFSVLDGHTS